VVSGKLSAIVAEWVSARSLNVSFLFLFVAVRFQSVSGFDEMLCYCCILEILRLTGCWIEMKES
jgi:hypothetical protein